MRKPWLPLVAVVLLGGCVEKLATPGGCPDLCPGDPIVVRDTMIIAAPGGDSSFFGYLPRAARTVLLVSSGLPAEEARSFVGFPAIRVDSITVDGTLVGLAVDTVAISFNLVARDSLTTGLVLYLHRIPLATDTTLTFDGVDALVTPASIIDSIVVPDSVRRGTVEALLTEDAIGLLAPDPDDSVRVALGLTMRADGPSGVALSLDLAGSTAAPRIEWRGRVDVTDTAKRRQAARVSPADLDKVGYVLQGETTFTPDPDLLYLGGPNAARALVRFAIPQSILDSAQILRATLELTPARPLLGLPNNPLGDSIAVRGVVADLGAKSPPIVAFGLQLNGGLREGTTQTVQVDLRNLVAQWQIENGPPPAVFLAHTLEGNSFMRPVFHSTRSSAGQPRLLLTYGLPTRPGRP